MHNQTVRIPGLLPPQRQQQLLHLPESAGELPVQIRQHHHPLTRHGLVPAVRSHPARFLSLSVVV